MVVASASASAAAASAAAAAVPSLIPRGSASSVMGSPSSEEMRMAGATVRWRVSGTIDGGRRYLFHSNSSGRGVELVRRTTDFWAVKTDTSPKSTDSCAAEPPAPGGGGEEGRKEKRGGGVRWEGRNAARGEGVVAVAGGGARRTSFEQRRLAIDTFDVDDDDTTGPGEM